MSLTDNYVWHSFGRKWIFFFCEDKFPNFLDKFLINFLHCIMHAYELCIFICNWRIVEQPLHIFDTWYVQFQNRPQKGAQVITLILFPLHSWMLGLNGSARETWGIDAWQFLPLSPQYEIWQECYDNSLPVRAAIRRELFLFNIPQITHWLQTVDSSVTVRVCVCSPYTYIGLWRDLALCEKLYHLKTNDANSVLT